MKGVLFWDFDGTLVYPNKRFIDTFLNSARGICFSREDVENHFLSIYPWLNFDVSYPDKTGDEWWNTFLANISPLFKKYNVSDTDAEKIRADFKSAMICKNTYTLYEDAKEVLSTLKKRGWVHYILSNNYPELSQIVENFGISDMFEEVIVSSNVGFEKPRQELYAYALARANHPENAYMIGDNPIADIKGGNAAGLKTVLVHREDSDEANYICKTLTELLDIVD